MVGDDGQGNQVGMAPAAKWIACRNMDQHGVGSPAQYIECLDWLMAPYPMGQPQLANPAMAPDVVNNSWDCPAAEGCDLTTLSAGIGGSGGRNLRGHGDRQLRIGLEYREDYSGDLCRLGQRRSN